MGVGRMRRWSVRGFAVVLGAVALVGVLAACDTTPVMVQGTVRTASGSLVGSVQVRLYANDAEALVAETTTNGVGVYELHQSTVADGTYRLRIGGQWWPAASSWAEATPLELRAAAATTADAVLGAAAWLSGTVVGSDGAAADGSDRSAAVALADVVVHVANANGDTVASGVTAADGSFTVGVAELGSYTVGLTDLTAGTTVVVGGTSPTVFTPALGEDRNIGTINSATGMARPTAIAAGQYHTCALRGTGTISCWGHGGSGQLGNGTTTLSPIPVTVAGITDAIAIAAGQYHTCALRGTGTISCWGANDYGQLGNGTSTQSPIPVTVAGITDAIAISTGGGHTCAVRGAGRNLSRGLRHGVMRIG